MSAKNPDFRRRVNQVRDRLVERLQAYRPSTRTYLTAACVGMTIGEYAHLASDAGTTPAAILSAVAALGSQLGVNLLADIIGDSKPPPGLTVEQIAQAVQKRIDQGDELPAVSALMQEFGTLQLALRTWQETLDRRGQELLDELSDHPQLVADRVVRDVIAALDPRLTSLNGRTQRILQLMEAVPVCPGPPPTGALTLFISGTQQDLQPEREAVEAAIGRLRMMPVRAETMGSRPLACREAIFDAVGKCDIYLGVYGGRYGHCVVDGGVSVTEMEYDEAQRLGKPTLVYVKEGERFEPAQEAFLRRVQDFDVGYFQRPRFSSLEELAEWVQLDVAALVSELVRDPDRVRHRQLALAYAGEVRQKFDYWRRRYVALPAHAALPVSESGQLAEIGATERAPAYFRPRGFRVSYGSTVQGRPFQRRKDERFDDARMAIAKVGDAILLGDPGGGKTTTLWRLMLDFADQAIDDPASPLPILLSLGDYDGQSEVLQFVSQQVRNAIIEDEKGNRQHLPAHWRLTEQIEKQLIQKRLILLFDGLNEIPRAFYDAATRRLDSFCATYHGNRFVFTCREIDYTVPLHATEIHIEPLDNDDMQAFVRAYLNDKAEVLLDYLKAENHRIRELGQNPYLLRMVVAIFEEYGTLPTNRVRLFGEFVGSLLLRERFTQPDGWQVAYPDLSQFAQVDALRDLTTRWLPWNAWMSRPDLYGLGRLDESVRKDLLMESVLTVMVLANLAYSMCATERWGTSVPHDFVHRTLRSYTDSLGTGARTDPNRVLYIGQGASLLECTANGYRFVHQLLQEYLAAVFVMTQNDAVSYLPQIAFESRRWSELLLLLSGMLPNPSRLVDKLIVPGCECWHVFLAARCVLEGSEIGESQLRKINLLLAEVLEHAQTRAKLDRDLEEALKEETFFRLQLDQDLEAEFWDRLLTDQAMSLGGIESRLYDIYWDDSDDLYESSSELISYTEEDELDEFMKHEQASMDEAQNSEADIRLLDDTILREREESEVNIRTEALTYVLNIGRRYSETTAIEVVRPLLEALAQEEYPHTSTIELLAGGLCEYHFPTGVSTVVHVFESPMTEPAALVALAPILQAHGYKEADLVLVDALCQELDDDDRQSVEEGLIDLAAETTAAELKRRYEELRDYASFDVLESLRYVIGELS